MNAKYYACFVLESGPTSLARELGSIVEIDEQVGSMMNHDDVAEMLADNLDLQRTRVVVHHWSRVH